jgi:hypothetical protein
VEEPIEDSVDELEGRYASGVHGPLDLVGDVVEVDTTGPVDVIALATRIRTLSE